MNYTKLSCSTFNPQPKPEPKEKKVKAKIKPRSDKRKKEEGVYETVKKVYLSNHPDCQTDYFQMRAHCTLKSNDIHHKKGRIGKLLYDPRYFMAVCRGCHNWIEKHPEMSKQLGYSLNRI